MMCEGPAVAGQGCTLRPGLLYSARLLFRATLRRFTRFNGFLPLGVPFGDPKGTEKVPATSDSAGGPA